MEKQIHAACAESTGHLIGHLWCHFTHSKVRKTFIIKGSGNIVLLQSQSFLLAQHLENSLGLYRWPHDIDIIALSTYPLEFILLERVKRVASVISHNLAVIS